MQGIREPIRVGVSHSAEVGPGNLCQIRQPANLAESGQPVQKVLGEASVQILRTGLALAKSLVQFAEIAPLDPVIEAANQGEDRRACLVGEKPLLVSQRADEVERNFGAVEEKILPLELGLSLGSELIGAEPNVSEVANEVIPLVTSKSKTRHFGSLRHVTRQLYRWLGPPH